MPRQTTEQRRRNRREQDTVAEEEQLQRAKNVGQAAVEAANTEEIIEEINGLLDELLDIDPILEEDAEQFVSDFRQYGGQ